MTAAGVSVYGDHQRNNVFYTIPKTPRIRLDEQGRPVFAFYKYRFPVDRPDGSKGGGLLFFDAENAIDDSSAEEIRQQKQNELNELYSRQGWGPAPAVELRTPTWLRGEVTLNLENAGKQLVQSVWHPTRPSLHGLNTVPFTVELTVEGSSALWEMLQGGGGVLQVDYELMAAAACPVEGTASFFYQKYYDFVQHVETHDPWVGDSSQVHTLTEQFRNSGAQRIDVTFPPGTPPDLQAQVTESLFGFIENLLKGATPADITPVSDEGRGTGDADTIDRHITITRTADFFYSISINQAIEWPLGPKGTLQNIGVVAGANWEDYAEELNLDDEFFQQAHLTVYVDADLANLPLSSVDLTIDFGTNKNNTFHFSSPTDIAKFNAYLSDNAGSRDFVYRYVVNYEGESRTFATGDLPGRGSVLTVPVGRLGIFDVWVEAGAIDFAQVQQAQVTLRYRDPDRGVDMEDVVVLDKDNRRVRSQEVIFAPRDKPFNFSVLYIMADGSRYSVGEQPHLSDEVFINGPFTDSETITVIALGDLDNDISTIFLELEYRDDKNHYSQDRTVALSKTNPFLSWSFPVIDAAAGKVTYSGKVTHKDHTETDIPETTTDRRMITVPAEGAEDVIRFEIVPDLIDWTKVRLAKVMIRYAADDIDETFDLVLRQGDKPAPIILPIRDRTHRTFAWNAVFYMATSPPSQRILAPISTTDPVIVLDPDAAVPAPTP
jgi:hypothetical protein